MSLTDELKRRNVFRVAAAYLVVGWLLTEVLTTILPELGAPEWAPRMVILVFALGFVPTVILSWVYEITPEGIKRDSEVPARQIRGKNVRFDYFVIATVFMLIVALAIFGARTTIEDAADGEISEASVAVLPFVNMSDDKKNEYFSDGLTETLLHMLAQIPDLKVAARTSSFAFKGKNKDIGEIAADLKVAHVLEGSVQQAGNRVRITAQLIRASDGFHVWSESYDRNYDDIFAIQDEIAVEVGSALSETLLGADSMPAVASIGTEDADAYDLYLQALSERSTYSFRGLQAAENLLKGALATDPDFLDAKNQLAMIYLQQMETGLRDRTEAIADIRALSAQVLEARPDDPLARATSEFISLLADDQATWPETLFAALDELERLARENPKNYNIGVMLARLLTGLQQSERALEVHLRALAEDPFNPRIHFELGVLYKFMDRPEDARTALSRSLELEPSQPIAYSQLAALDLLGGNGIEYVNHMLKALTIDPGDYELPGAIARFLYNLELIEEGDDFRNLVMALAPNSEIAYALELLRAERTGDHETAIASARRAIEDDVEERYGSFSRAVLYLTRRSIEDGTIEETRAYLEENIAGLTNVGALDITAKTRWAQIASSDAWYASLPREEAQARMDALLASATEFGLDPLEDDKTRFAVQAYRGQTDAAIETGLNDVFTKSVTDAFNWRQEYAQAQYSDVVADPRIQEALARWEEEWNAMRASVRRYLADLSTET